MILFFVLWNHLLRSNNYFMVVHCFAMTK